MLTRSWSPFLWCFFCPGLAEKDNLLMPESFTTTPPPCPACLKTVQLPELRGGTSSVEEKSSVAPAMSTMSSSSSSLGWWRPSKLPVQYPGFSIPPNPAGNNTRVRLKNTTFKQHSRTAGIGFTSVALGCIFSIQAPHKLRHCHRKRLKRSLFQLHFTTDILGGVCGLLRNSRPGHPQLVLSPGSSLSVLTAHLQLQGSFPQSFPLFFGFSNSAVRAETSSPRVENTTRPRKSRLLAQLAQPFSRYSRDEDQLTKYNRWANLVKRFRAFFPLPCTRSFTDKEGEMLT